MKFNFKKVMSVLGSVVLVGSSMGMAAAIGTYPTPYVNNGVANVAVVYGTGSAPSDLVAAGNIQSNLKTVFDEFYGNETTESENITTIINSGDFSNSLGITEDEIVLGQSIIQKSIQSLLTDNKVPTLIDGKIYWDDGVSTKTNFNVHEEIRLDNMEIITTFDNLDLESTALTNNKGLEYRYVFEETLNGGLIGTDDADSLEITILGKEYVVEEFTDNSMTISSSKKSILKAGDTIVVAGKTLTIEDIFDGTVQVNNYLIDEGKTKKIDGIEVKVETVAYHSSDGKNSKVILRVGKELTTLYSDGDSYVGEDDSDPLWVWDIESPGEAGGWIGVKYDQRMIDDEDDLVYVGESYDLPENYGSVQFNALTDVDYQEYEVFFEESKDLYAANLTHSNEKMYYDVEVLGLKGDFDDSFLINGEETDEVYLYFNENTIDASQSTVDVFYNDVNKDYSNTIRPRYIESFNLYEKGSVNGVFGELVFEDTSFDLEISITDSVTRVLSIGDLEVTLNSNGAFTHLGTTEEEADAGELSLDGKDLGSKDEDIFTHNGVTIKNPESNSEDDTVVLDVPSEQVYATISVLGVGEAIETTVGDNGEVISTIPQLGSIIVKDTEVDSVKDKNLIVVGGSCINKAAAKILGIPENTCAEAFTAHTGIGTGQYILKEFTSPYNSEKVAILAAGYEAADTTAAVTALLA